MTDDGYNSDDYDETNDLNDSYWADEQYTPCAHDLEAMAEAESWHLHELAQHEVQSWWDYHEGEKYNRLAPPLPDDLREQMVEAVEDALQGIADPVDYEADFDSEGNLVGVLRILTHKGNAAVNRMRFETVTRLRPTRRWRQESARGPAR